MDGAEVLSQRSILVCFAHPDDELSWVVRGLARLHSDPLGALTDFDAALAAGREKGHLTQDELIDALHSVELTPEVLAALLARFVVRHFWLAGRIRLVGDDTVDEHRGKKVFGKGRHRDAVRSSHSYTAFRYGHKWVVLAILVRLPFTTSGTPRICTSTIDPLLRRR